MAKCIGAQLSEKLSQPLKFQWVGGGAQKPIGGHARRGGAGLIDPSGLARELDTSEDAMTCTLILADGRRREGNLPTRLKK